MKKLLGLIALIVLALVIFEAPEKMEISKAEVKQREEVKALPVSQAVKEATALVEELKKTGTDLEVKEARKEFKTSLKHFKEVTDNYNEKAIAGAVTPEDEKQYQVSMEKSLRDFKVYQDAVFKEMNTTKEI